MKPFFATILLTFGIVTGAQASVTFQLSDLGGGIVSNLANASGTVANDMRWGVVVDTNNNGFAGSGTSYDAYSGGVGVVNSGFLGFGGSTTDDYYIAGTKTVNSSPWDDAGGTAGLFLNGSILDDINNVTLPGGTIANSHFALIWFSNSTSVAGSKYGFITDSTFVIPADGNTVNVGNFFLGNDPIRTASSTFASLAPVPEPSRVLLLGLGALGLISRRRRSIKVA